MVVALAEELAAQTYTERQADVLTALDAEAANLANALEWATATAPESALRLCVALSTWWRLRAKYAEADAAASRALAAASDGALAPRVMAEQAFMLSRRAAFDEAAALADRALELADGEPDATARALLASASALIGDPAASGAAAARGMEIAAYAQDPMPRNLCMYLVGLMHAERDDRDTARDLLTQVFQDAERTHDREVPCGPRPVCPFRPSPKVTSPARACSSSRRSDAHASSTK